MRVAITHAAWAPGRRASLERLLVQLQTQECGLRVFTSSKREPAALWATRLWEWVAGERETVVCLNDDVVVYPNLIEICRAITRARPGETVSLHTNMAAAPEAAMAGHHMARSPWLTGPAYLLAPCDARAFLEWPAPWDFLSRINEDQRAIHAAWSLGKTFLCTIPAVVTHDTSVASTLGYDQHPNRTPTVPREDFPDADLTDTAYWQTPVDPPFLPNPWLPVTKLERIQALVDSRQPICSMCLNQAGVVGQTVGATLCDECLGRCWRARCAATR